MRTRASRLGTLTKRLATHAGSAQEGGRRRERSSGRTKRAAVNYKERETRAASQKRADAERRGAPAEVALQDIAGEVVELHVDAVELQEKRKET
jgi:hypothetical protein